MQCYKQNDNSSPQAYPTYDQCSESPRSMYVMSNTRAATFPLLYDIDRKTAAARWLNFSIIDKKPEL